MSTTNSTATYKHFMRCRDCLSAVYVERETRNSIRAACAACGNRQMEWVGILNNGRATLTAEVSVCDSECTSARGIKCACSCEGKNHGSGATVTIKVDNGAAVVQTIPTPEACAIANEYIEARRALRATVADIHAKRASGQWLPRDEFNRLLDVDQRLQRASKLLTHSKRMAVLTA